jgi:C4-dicarboxylate-specific signal transduction histidine kinase
VESVESRAGQLAVGISVHGPDVQVHVDVVQIECALQNLLNNALDALASAPGRREIAVSLAGDPRAGRALITIRDSGPGVPADIAPHLFRPFTTTKPQGMGMGLVISRSLVGSNGGELVHRPGPADAGACFVVTLPTSPRLPSLP